MPWFRNKQVGQLRRTLKGLDEVIADQGRQRRLALFYCFVCELTSYDSDAFSAFADSDYPDRPRIVRSGFTVSGDHADAYFALADEGVRTIRVIQYGEGFDVYATTERSYKLLQSIREHNMLLRYFDGRQFVESGLKWSLTRVEDFALV